MLNQVLASDQLVASGLLLIVAGSVLASMKRVPFHIWNFLENHTFVSLHVFDEDEAFFWMKIWLGHKLAKAKSKSTFTQRNDRDNCEFIDNIIEMYQKSGKEDKPTAQFVPAPGTYFFRFNHRLFWVTYTRTNSESPSGQSRPRESIVIRGLSQNTKIIEQMVLTARDAAIPDDGKVEVRIAKQHSWSQHTRVDKRSVESVILPNNLCQEVVTNIRKFQAAKGWYNSMGIPYRKGILLYGPPGNGKTSLVLAVASALNMNVNILFLGDSTITDSVLNDLLSRMDNNTIVLIEDIDCTFQNRKAAKGSKSLGVSFSGLLNAIDGLATQGGRVLFMTTNKLHELDPALIRPGRADDRILIANATPGQAKEIFSRFYPGSPEEQAIQFSEKIPDGMLSMAAIQGHLLKYRDNSKQAVDLAGELLESKVKEE